MIVDKDDRPRLCVDRMAGDLADRHHRIFETAPAEYHLAQQPALLVEQQEQYRFGMIVGEPGEEIAGDGVGMVKHRTERRDGAQRPQLRGVDGGEQGSWAWMFDRALDRLGTGG